MYLHLGNGVVTREDGVIGVFDLDNSSQSHITRAFLRDNEKAGNVVSVSDELPKSFVLCEERNGTTLYLSQLNSSTLLKRSESSELYN